MKGQFVAFCPWQQISVPSPRSLESPKPSMSLMNYTDLLLIYLAGAAIKLDKSLWQIKSTRSARLIPTLTFTPVLVSVIQRKEKPWTETLIKTNALQCGQIERTACRNLGYVIWPILIAINSPLLGNSYMALHG